MELIHKCIYSITHKIKNLQKLKEKRDHNLMQVASKCYFSSFFKTKVCLLKRCFKFTTFYKVIWKYWPINQDALLYLVIDKNIDKLSTVNSLASWVQSIYWPELLAWSRFQCHLFHTLTDNLNLMITQCHNKTTYSCTNLVTLLSQGLC